MNKAWTAEELEAAKGFLQLGWTSTQIGAKLNRTRNSVIGALHRRSVKLAKPKAPKAVTEKRPKVQRATPAEKKEVRFQRPPISMRSRFSKPFIDRVTAAKDDRPVKLMEAQRYECKYILTQDHDKPFNTMCCGAIIFNGSSWCKTHYDIVFIPQKDKRR